MEYFFLSSSLVFLCPFYKKLNHFFLNFDLIASIKDRISIWGIRLSTRNAYALYDRVNFLVTATDVFEHIMYNYNLVPYEKFSEFLEFSVIVLYTLLNLDVVSIDLAHS
jgi:hypothetical protein